MSAEAEAAAGETGESGCWCCGRITSQEALVHLGNHPEVGICVSCVRFLGRRAREGLPGIADAYTASGSG